MANKDKDFYVVLYCIFLFSACSLNTFGEENGTNEGPKSESISTAQKQRVDDISPGEVVISNMEHDGKTTETSKTLDGEKKVEIKQSEDGKTKEEVKAHEDTKQPEEEGGKEGEKKEEEQAESEEEKNKEEEKEPGIDLKILNDSDFEHLTQASSGATTGDWLVIFSKTDCENCTMAEKELKQVYERLRHKLNVAKVEQGSSSKLTFKRFRIEDLPFILFLHHGKKYTFEGNQIVEELINFAEEKYQLMPWAVVRDPYTSFELFVEESYEELQHMVRYKKNVCLIIFLSGFAVGISLTSICGSILFHLLENFKVEDEDEMEEETNYKLTKNKAE